MNPCTKRLPTPFIFLLFFPEQVIAEFPDLQSEHITACLDYARELCDGL